MSAAPRSHFITDIIDADLASNRHGGKVVTRFPPEPNGYLHIGHSKSILLNFGLAEQYRGLCHLRMDDTNPVTEDTDYVRSIQEDVAWLGGQWDGEVRFASDYFGKMYALAERLVEQGDAYVDSQSVEEIRLNRGDFNRPGSDSPFRTRTIAENLALLRGMKAGEFADGTLVLRAKIDMAQPNVLMRDPLLYRIRRAHHHRTGDSWCIYPMYDYAHPLEDAVEGITHSICTLEFESNRELYDWVVDHTGPWDPRPHQYEFARLKLGYTVMSKRKLLQLVQDKRVSGWDDPRMPTIAGMRRRGVRPEALRDLAELVGVAKHNSVVDIGKFEFCVRRDLEKSCPRALAVLDPLPVVLTNWPDDMVRQLSVPWWPGQPERGVRAVPFSKHLLLEREDFSLQPPPDWKRLAPGVEVRLYGAYFVRCDGVERAADGSVARLRCTVDLHSEGGTAPDGRQPAATLHWVDAAHSCRAEARLYDRLFAVEQPDAEGDFLPHLHPHSLTVAQVHTEAALAQAVGGQRYQFMRQGYFFADPVDSIADQPVWNRTIALRDTWAKPTAKTDSQPDRTPKAPKAAAPSAAAIEAQHVAHVQGNPQLLALADRWQLPRAALGRLAQDPELTQFLQEALPTAGDGTLALRLLQNEVAGALHGRKLAQTAVSPPQFGALVALVHRGELSMAAAKQLVGPWLTEGGEPRALAKRLGLLGGDAAVIDSAVAAVLAEMPQEIERLRNGEHKLLGALLGATLRKAKGADPQAVRQALLHSIDTAQPHAIG